ncbi:MAG: hypothetical protein Q8P41_26960 [Pseudomonadota bacterium]|nr:hypothetical protein [Pseudomonadota bacterium]
MTRLLLAFGPALLLVSCAVALAQGVDPVPATPTSPVPGGDYLLTLGPYGALVWGAYLLGRGLKITVQVELSERDRELLRGGLKA